MSSVLLMSEWDKRLEKTADGERAHLLDTLGDGGRNRTESPDAVLSARLAEPRPSHR